MTFESLQCNIKTHIKGLLRLLFVESPGQSHVAASSCYRRRLVDRRMYPSVWTQNCLFSPIGKATAMVRFLSPRPTHKDSILYYKVVKVTINAPKFTEVIVNLIVCLSVVIDSGALYRLGTCHCCAMFYELDAVLLSRSICKLAALPKSRMVAREAYLLSFCQFWAIVNFKLDE